MLQCELCSRQAEVAALPLVGDVTPSDVVLAHTIAYTCTTCAAKLIELERVREMPLEDHNAIFDTETQVVRDHTGWLRVENILDAATYR